MTEGAEERPRLHLVTELERLWVGYETQWTLATDTTVDKLLTDCSWGNSDMVSTLSFSSFFVTVADLVDDFDKISEHTLCCFSLILL